MASQIRLFVPPGTSGTLGTKGLKECTPLEEPFNWNDINFSGTLEPLKRGTFSAFSQHFGELSSVVSVCGLRTHISRSFLSAKYVIKSDFLS